MSCVIFKDDNNGNDDDDENDQQVNKQKMKIERWTIQNV